MSVFRDSVFSMAALAAHSTAKAQGFQQKDVKFFSELMLNWMETSPLSSLQIHKTQVMRFLSRLCEQGFAKELPRKTRPEYVLTKPGTIELINSTVSGTDTQDEMIIFRHFFVRTYGERLKSMMTEDKENYSKALLVEIEAMLNPNDIINRQIEATQLKIKRLEARIEDTLGAYEMFEKMRRLEEPLSATIKKVSQSFPYDLNHQKPMAELINEIPEEQRAWELSIGNYNRAEILWKNQKSLLERRLQLLKGLLV